ncbi:hypothetical protein HYV82_06315 [Candidatus Woesearchaeota archaeon]|nr:hypothetical protein [Candidatus Woesearchaeota archaeon]
MTNTDKQRADIESRVLACYTDGVPGFLQRLVIRVHIDEIRERIRRSQEMYDFCADKVEYQKEAGLDAQVVVADNGSSYCYGKVVLEKEVAAWPDVDGWFKPPKSRYSRGAFGYEMDGGEPWIAHYPNGARITISKPKEVGAGYIITVRSNPNYFADAMTVAVMLAGAAPIPGSAGFPYNIPAKSPAKSEGCEG